MLKVSHDPQVDALYVTLSDKPYAFGEDLDYARRIDYAEDRTPIGIELLYVSHGVDLADLPHSEELGRILQRQGIPHRGGLPGHTVGQPVEPAPGQAGEYGASDGGHAEDGTHVHSR